MNPKELIERMKQEDDKNAKLKSKIYALEQELKRQEENSAHVIFKDTTLEELEKIWNKSDENQRYDIMTYIPEIKYQIDKLDSHGGLRSGEIEEEIYSKKWNESEWLEPNYEFYFEDYCKKV